MMVDYDDRRSCPDLWVGRIGVARGTLIYLSTHFFFSGRCELLIGSRQGYCPNEIECDGWN